MAERALINVDTDVVGDDLRDILDEFDGILEAEVPRILETDLDPIEFTYGETTIVLGTRLGNLAVDQLGEAA